MKNIESYRWRVMTLVIAVLLIALSLVWPVEGWPARVDRDLVVLYEFKETSGMVIQDVAPLVPALNLTMLSGSNVEWLNPGLRVKTATRAKAGSPLKLDKDVFFNKGITIEVWIKPLNNTQAGPARIVTYSQDSANRNFTLGQEGEHYQQRFRTSATNPNGSDISLTTPASSIASPPILQHVVYTRSETGLATFYINDLEVQAMQIPGDNSTWDTGYTFGLFNETSYPTDTRTWLGDIFLVAIYGDDLTGAEVKQNYVAGVPTAEGMGEVTLAWDANTEEDLAGYKIYSGAVSRKVDTTVKMEQWCEEHEPSNANCVTEWEAICKDKSDQACHSLLHGYDRIEDVGKVTEYTLTNLERGKTYYLAATAYDDKRNESSFSEELVHTVTGVVGPPKKVKVEKIQESK
jgi:hypothetical protein